MADHDWHLQISNRDWILWGYGPVERFVGFVEPANSLMDFRPPVKKFWISFSLPLATKGLKSPRIYDRIHTWGWRIRSNDYYTDIGWRLADTKEQAIKDARNYIETSDSIRNSERDVFRSALKDVRESVVEDEPGPSPRDWSPKKKR